MQFPHNLKMSQVTHIIVLCCTWLPPQQQQHHLHTCEFACRLVVSKTQRPPVGQKPVHELQSHLTLWPDGHAKGHAKRTHALHHKICTQPLVRPHFSTANCCCVWVSALKVLSVCSRDPSICVSLFVTHSLSLIFQEYNVYSSPPAHTPLPTQTPKPNSFNYMRGNASTPQEALAQYDFVFVSERMDEGESCDGFNNSVRV